MLQVRDVWVVVIHLHVPVAYTEAQTSLYQGLILADTCYVLSNQYHEYWSV